MKKLIISKAVQTTLLLISLSIINYYIVLPRFGYNGGEIFGYLSMFVSMIFIFLGIKEYRDKINAGKLNFMEGLKIGALISVIPSVGFGLFDVIYTEFLNPNWGDEYFKHYAEKLKATTPPDQWQTVLSGLESQKEMWSNPLLTFFIMGITVFLIGIIVSVIAAVSLKQK